MEVWKSLIECDDYEINKDTLQIRRKSNHRIVKEYIDKGYVRFRLNNKMFFKHRIVCNNFVPNPDGYGVVDHINNIKTDNRISNLRWCSQKMNTNNRFYQEFVDEISDDAIVVDKYSNWQFEFLYFDLEKDTFYVYNGINYVVKPKYESKNGFWYISIFDKTGKGRKIYYNKFKREYDLI